MLDMGFIRDVRKIVAACRRSGRRCCSRPPCRTDIAKLAAEILRDAGSRRRLAGQASRPIASTSASISCRRKPSARCSPSCSPIPPWTACSSSPAPSTAPTGSAEASAAGRRRRRTRCTATSRRTRGSARSTRSAAGRPASSSPPISPRAGIDVPAISHVINYELPNEPRATCTASAAPRVRAPAGIAISFCDPSERSYLKAIERLTRVSVPVAEHRLAQGQPAISHQQRPDPRSTADARRGQATTKAPSAVARSAPRARRSAGEHSEGVFATARADSQAARERPLRRRA